MPYSRCIYEVRSFHGLASFYGKFIRNFSRTCALIVETIMKEYQPYKWTANAEQHVLVLPDIHKPLRVKCDASGMAIGVVLSQDDKLIAYFSEKLNDAKQKYSTYNKYFYAVILSLKKWRLLTLDMTKLMLS